MKKRKFNIFNILLVAVLLIGLVLILYPTVSDYINNLHQSRAIVGYAEDVANIDKDEYERVLKSAKDYNKSLLKKNSQYIMTEDDYKDYNSELDISGKGIMGYVEVPKINCSLPIYHGTSDGVLQTSIGHLDWTSLPVGGESTHCVLSGHRGLPSAKIFTDLDVLREGDVFYLRVLDETLTYEVDQILIVEPEQTQDLEIVEGQDYCTLLTCTPYGVNSHRLLVRGHRIENQKNTESVRVVADAMQIDPIMIAPLVAVPLLLILIFVVFLRPVGKRNKEDGEES